MTLTDPQRATEMKEQLVAEVKKTDPNFAQALSAGIVNLDHKTLTITVQKIIPEQRLEPAYKAATSLGLKLQIAEWAASHP